MRECTASTLWCLPGGQLPKVIDSASESEENRSLLGDHEGAVLDSAGEQCWGERDLAITSIFPLDGTLDLLSTGPWSQSLRGGGGGAISSISSLAASKISGVEGNFRPSSCLSLHRESMASGLD